MENLPAGNDGDLGYAPGEESSSGGMQWYALVSKPHHEKTVAQYLSDKGLKSFLPLYKDRRVWSDRIKELELPLFAGYVFCHFAAPQRVSVLRTPGVRSVVSFGGEMASLRDEEVAAIQQLVGSGLPVQPWPFLKTGDRVRIQRGPLRGLEGILLQIRTNWRLVVSVELLQRSVAVEIESHNIAK